MVTFALIPLAKSSHMAKTDMRGPGKCIVLTITKGGR